MKKKKDFPVFQMEKLWIKSQKNSGQNAICVFDVQQRTKFSFTIFCNICKKKKNKKRKRYDNNNNDLVQRKYRILIVLWNILIVLNVIRVNCMKTCRPFT